MSDIFVRNTKKLLSFAMITPILFSGCDVDSNDSSTIQTIVIEGTSSDNGYQVDWKSDESKPAMADTTAVEITGVPVLGNGNHTLEGVTLTLIANQENGLNRPRDLAFNPTSPNQLWIVNQSDDSAVIVENAGTTDQRSFKVIDPAADHFMEEVSSISFGSPGRFATCQESGNTYNNRANPNLFMGPTLWSADYEIFGKTNPDAVRYQGFDLGSHLDMLHESPYCVGIEWAGAEAYFTFDGMTNSITLTDFREDHGPGFDDHSDGVMVRYATDQVKRQPGVPSHMVFDQESGLLWIADTGNRRIGVMNMNTPAEDMVRLPVIEPGTQLLQVMDHEGVITVPGTQDLLSAPSGLAMYDGVLYVSDAASGLIVALSQDGEVLDWLNTGAPGIFGLEFDTEGNLYLAHGTQNLIVKISPTKTLQ